MKLLFTTHNNRMSISHAHRTSRCSSLAICCYSQMHAILTAQPSPQPSPERILYKTAVLTYKALDGGAPRYLSSIVHITDVPDRRALRSAGSNHLQIPPFKLSTIGDRAFPVTAARFWNRLPDNVTSTNSLSAFQQQL